ncbi:hypothetical protein ODJ79_46205 [Actinoplanes sp. KI2]|uniref:hypothetical protein n=1 Tax=Actinoplanes sp. KI2 TaxID=2983315 RepID=UPI0021D5FC1A|nr:hypothetical protein [Actinoplanes sp. KI2]MCU7731151.1 hypothetical protein [Actinoplanes sp. KI2]
MAFTIRTVWRPAVCAGLAAAAVALREGLADGLAALDALPRGSAEGAGVVVASTIGANPALVLWSAPPEHPTSAATSTPLTSAAAPVNRVFPESATLRLLSTAGRHAAPHPHRRAAIPLANNKNSR